MAAARLAMVLPLVLAKTAVIQVPMFAPKTRYRPALCPALTPMMPLAAKACMIPMDAEEDCMIAVKMAPTSTPIIGFSKLLMKERNHWLSRNGAIAVLIVFIPKNRIPKPATRVK